MIILVKLERRKMITDAIATFNDNSSKAIKAFIDKLSTFRTGRATSSLVENLMVDTYGTKMPLKSLSSISIPDPKIIMLQPWDRNNIPFIEKAILTSNLGLTPQTEGNIIRVVVPALTGERREEFKKLVKQESENSRVTIRGFRKEAMDEIKLKKESKELSEDEETRAKNELQKEVDARIEEIDSLLNKKITELDQI
ncbi:MAG: Ribosome-recycling factor [candidate division CPR3 bacterium GW2011_GWE2_35_7]|uniref:Ribosome-recycling factor n=1 Tax=candidate division CPR3 bacterium GW2011_GWF2_35_18 TaxID=1618350 RepID=A0A0G0BJ18_UNCC3|nr:MAG: Ribosome-recycling factor [candidate division CPR3 bacterium GW2011_GWF2_35_18]KKP85509.1 MAG: Ribosome-recycling factor [candidate division CPR3 bacterium GW2011_GWE2_35_7]